MTRTANVPARYCRRIGGSDQRGTASFEFVLMLPLLTLVLMLLIGMGHTLINKHQVMVGARFAAQYHSVHHASPAISKVEGAAATKETNWRVVRDSGTHSDQAANDEIMGKMGGVEDRTLGVFGSLLNMLSGDTRLSYFATTQPTKGIIPRLYPDVGPAVGKYRLEYDTWTCENARGSYMGILVRNLPFGSLGGVQHAMDSLACCSNYKSSDVSQ